MTSKSKFKLISVILIIAIAYLPTPVGAQGVPKELQFLSPISIKEYRENISSDTLHTLILDDSTTFQIVPQPVGNRNFVTPLPNYVTEFQTALNYGTIGLLAHNYLAGRYFFQILPGQVIKLVYSDNKTESFVVTQIQKYQALSPNDPSSEFIDLATGEQLTASQLFNKIYKNQAGHLVLQTCLYADQKPTWGRLFIIAEPVTQTSKTESLGNKFEQ